MPPAAHPAHMPVELPASSCHGVFEGPEKKLELHFAPQLSPLSSPALSDRTDLSDSASDISDTDLPARIGLRALTRLQIDSILRAARCTVISITRSHHTDAYLLSESSLFVTDYSLMIKTCGTTTLLHALPVILRLAYEMFALQITQVQFSRLAYLFPHEQSFPHDCFQNEVAFLDSTLDTIGLTYELQGSTDSKSKWSIYLAQFDHINNETVTYLPDIAMPEDRAVAQPRQALEINMFDLDETVMQHFMFSDVEKTGTEPAIKHTTAAAGIKSLMDENAIIDAFNFQPCGYSMNALLDAAYYTIHVTPEPDASYVSFETTTEKHLLPQLVAAVVKVFQPGRFTVSLVASGRSENYIETMRSRLDFSILLKLLRGEYAHNGEQMFNKPSASCAILAASFRSKDDLAMATEGVTMMNTGDRMVEISDALKDVSESYGARIMNDDEIFAGNEQNIAIWAANSDPTFIVDLGAIARNVQKIRSTCAPQCSKLRYSVRCNSDEAILSLLDKLDFEFEAANLTEVGILHKIGIARRKIALVTPILTPSVMAALERVGMIAVFEAPGSDFLAALEHSNVAVEIRTCQTAVAEVGPILSKLQVGMDKITSIAVDSAPDKTVSSCAKESGSLLEWLGGVQAFVEQLPLQFRRGLTVNVGEMWQSAPSDVNDDDKALNDAMADLVTSTSVNIGVDVSCLVVQNSISLVLRVIGLRRRQIATSGAQDGDGDTVTSYSYYLSDGVYGAFSSIIMQKPDTKRVSRPAPTVFARASDLDVDGAYPNTAANTSDDRATECCDGILHPSILFGPTCDALDRIWEGELPALHVGDSLLFADMGAFSASAVSSFNGFGDCFNSRYVVSSIPSGI